MKVGDKVFSKDYGEGKIIGFFIGLYAVEYKKPFKNFHDCDSLGRYGYCYWETPLDIKKMEELQLELF